MRRHVDSQKRFQPEVRRRAPPHAVLNRFAAPRNEIDRTIGKRENKLAVKLVPAVQLSWPRGTSFVFKQSISNLA